MKHWRKVKGEQVVLLQMAHQLKTKNVNVIPGELFCRQCKAKFLLETENHCIVDQVKVQSVTDTDNEFAECQTPRKKLQSIGISPVSLHAFMKTLKNNISEAQKVQVECLNNLQSENFSS